MVIKFESEVNLGNISETNESFNEFTNNLLDSEGVKEIINNSSELKQALERGEQQDQNQDLGDKKGNNTQNVIKTLDDYLKNLSEILMK